MRKRRDSNMLWASLLAAAGVAALLSLVSIGIAYLAQPLYAALGWSTHAVGSTLWLALVLLTLFFADRWLLRR
jgi:hypothetical protein